MSTAGGANPRRASRCPASWSARGGEGKGGEVIMSRQASRLKPVTDCRQRGLDGAVVDSIGLGRVLVQAVRISFGHDRGEVVIADGPARRRGAKKGQILLRVI